MHSLARIRHVDRPRRAMAGSIEHDVSLLLDFYSDRAAESFTLLHRCVQGVPRPVLCPIHVTEHGLPRVDFDLARTVHVHAIDC
jgi:hypothetical protein